MVTVKRNRRLLQHLDTAGSPKNQLRTEKLHRKILVLEDPSRHESRLWSGALKSWLEKKSGIVITVTENLPETLAKLGSDQFGVVIIHYHDFTAIEFLRARHPHVKYVATSQNMSATAGPGTFGELLDLRLKKSYDFLLYPESIDAILEQLQKILETVEKADSQRPSSV